MKIRNNHLDNFILSVIENITEVLSSNFQPSRSIFASYGTISFVKNETKEEVEISIDTEIGLIDFVEKNTITNNCIIYPNSLDVSSLLTEKCDSLFLKISDCYWINKEATIRIKKQQVYGLCYFFSFELVV